MNRKCVKMTEVVVLIGAGSIGIAIARRVSAGKTILVADLRQENAERVAKTLREAGYNVETATVDIAERVSVYALADKARQMGTIKYLIHAAGVSPSQVDKETVLRVDLYGTALILDIFGDLVTKGSSAIVISSQSGYRLPALGAEKDSLLATTPTEELLDLEMLSDVKDGLEAYQYAKRGNGLRVQSQAVHWGKKGARINTISPGIVMTPLALDELNGPRGAGYKAMIAKTVQGRACTPDEIGALGEFLLRETGSFINGSDFLMDGGVTANYWYGDVDEVR